MVKRSVQAGHFVVGTNQSTNAISTETKIVDSNDRKLEFGTDPYRHGR
jgi:hypothetical protein